jgi:hypothetical protein
MSTETINSFHNIIAGPNDGDYWNHSGGITAPLTREDGPFPLQGNIGALMKNEAANYVGCSVADTDTSPLIGSSPNCTGSFVPDIYTTTDTCGDNCKLKYPESYGLQDFGFPSDSPKITNAHQLHLYTNQRALMAGQYPGSLGSYEWIPNISVDENTNSAYLDPKAVYQQVGNWGKLPQYKNIVYSNFNSNFTSQQ